MIKKRVNFKRKTLWVHIFAVWSRSLRQEALKTLLNQKTSRNFKTLENLNNALTVGLANSENSNGAIESKYLQIYVHTIIISSGSWGIFWTFSNFSFFRNSPWSYNRECEHSEIWIATGLIIEFLDAKISINNLGKFNLIRTVLRNSKTLKFWRVPKMRAYVYIFTTHTLKNMD